MRKVFSSTLSWVLLTLKFVNLHRNERMLSSFLWQGLPFVSYFSAAMPQGCPLSFSLCSHTLYRMHQAEEEEMLVRSFTYKKECEAVDRVVLNLSYKLGKVLSILNIFQLLLCSVGREKAEYKEWQVKMLHKNVGSLSVPCVNCLAIFYFWPALKITQIRLNFFYCLSLLIMNREKVHCPSLSLHLCCLTNKRHHLHSA